MTATPPSSLPGILAVEAALRLLDPDSDPTSIAAGQPDSHRHAALLAHLAAGATGHADRAERRAGFAPETLLDIHLHADVAATDSGPDSPDRTLAWLQIVRVRRARHIVYALRGNTHSRTPAWRASTRSPTC